MDHHRVREPACWCETLRHLATLRASCDAPRAFAAPALLAALLCVLAVEPARSADVADLRAVGSKDTLWILIETADEDPPQTRVWMRRRDRGFRRPQTGSLQPMGIERAAALGSDLHLFYRSGAHYRLDSQRVMPQRVLPDRQVPLRLATDNTKGTLYAIARAVRPGATPTKTPATSTAPKGPVATAPTATRSSEPGSPSEATWALYRFEVGSWEVASPLPAWFRSEEQHWLCADDARVHLFSLAPHPDAPVRHRVWSEGSWRRLDDVPLPPTANPLAAMVANTYLALIAWVPGKDAPSSLIGAKRLSGEWMRFELSDPDNETLGLSPERLQVTAFNDRIAVVARFEPEGPIQLGLWTTEGGPPEADLETLPQWPSDKDALRGPRLPEAVGYIILAAVIAMIFWRRQQSMIRDIPLPEDIRLAQPGWRFLAFLLDLAPPLLIVGVLFIPWLSEVLRQLEAEDLTGNEWFERFLGSLAWPWIATRALYVVYVGATEYAWSTSPGKRLFRCYIVSEDLSRPLPQQIALRNVLKFLELQPEVFALLVFIILTRNQQRLGDVLARTIVVQPVAG